MKKKPKKSKLEKEILKFEKWKEEVKKNGIKQQKQITPGGDEVNHHRRKKMKLKELKKVIDQFLSDPNNPKYYDMDWRQEYSQEEAKNYLYVISTDYITYKIKDKPEIEIDKEEIKEMIYKDLEGNIYFKDLMNWLNDNRKSIEWMEQVIIEDQLTRAKEEYLFEDHIRTAQKMQMDQVLPAMINEFIEMIEKNEDKKEDIN